MTHESTIEAFPNANPLTMNRPGVSYALEQDRRMYGLREREIVLNKMLQVMWLTVPIGKLMSLHKSWRMSSMWPLVHFSSAENNLPVHSKITALSLRLVV